MTEITIDHWFKIYETNDDKWYIRNIHIKVLYYHHSSIYNKRNVAFSVQSQENYNKINIDPSPSQLSVYNNQ